MNIQITSTQIQAAALDGLLQTAHTKVPAAANGINAAAWRNAGGAVAVKALINVLAVRSPGVESKTAAASCGTAAGLEAKNCR
mmetsp:Transcript_27186/g.56399  ORF Transcript_27186/g.56399 Transcript_27186/m.56399 type:complete len:83 (+) Transcript_27186:350-598(+)